MRSRILPHAGFVALTAIMGCHSDKKDTHVDTHETGCVSSSGGGNCETGFYVWDCTYDSAVVEVCDGIDNNCDGQIDEGVTSTYLVDQDGDGFGQSTVTVQACEAYIGLSEVGGDCDDGDQYTHPDALERCDGVDNDCDGSTDEDCVRVPFPGVHPP